MTTVNFVRERRVVEENGNDSVRSVPAWLQEFVSFQYFGECDEHAHKSSKSKAGSDESSSKKLDKNYFCVDCGEGPFCATGRKRDHPSHLVMQVRKASRSDSIRIADVAKVVNVRHIQSYIINGAKIVFIHSRPQAKPTKGAPRYCQACNRSLQDEERFCSLECKLRALVQNPSDTSITFATGDVSMSSSMQNAADGEAVSVDNDDRHHRLSGPSSTGATSIGKKRVRANGKSTADNAFPSAMMGRLPAAVAAMQMADFGNCKPVLKILKLKRDSHAHGAGMGHHAGGHNSPTSVLAHDRHHREDMSPVSAEPESTSTHDPVGFVSFRMRPRKGNAIRSWGVGILA